MSTVTKYYFPEEAKNEFRNSQDIIWFRVASYSGCDDKYLNRTITLSPFMYSEKEEMEFCESSYGYFDLQEETILERLK